MYKALNDEDIIVGKFPVVEPAGSDDGGVLVLDADYNTRAYNSGAGVTTDSRKRYGQIASIIGEVPIANGNATVFTRNSFKESIHPRSFSVNGTGIDTGSLVYTNAGRQFQGASGGWYLYPDVGILLSPGSVANLKGCSEETVTVTNIFVRIDPSEFNYSQNPSFSDVENYVRFPNWADNPRTFITTIGFYNDNGDCLAVAKLPKPQENSFEKALLFRIELKF